MEGVVGKVSKTAQGKRNGVKTKVRPSAGSDRLAPRLLFEQNYAKNGSDISTKPLTLL